MTEWDKLRKGHHAWDHTKSGSRYVEKLITEGDRLKDRMEYLEALINEDVKMITSKLVEIQRLERIIATGYCGECDIHKEKLEDIRAFLRNTSVPPEEVPDIIMEMLKVESE